MKKKFLCVAMLAAMGLSGSAWGTAMTVQTAMPVTAYLGGTCSVNATPVNFGTLPLSITGQADTTSTLTVNCSPALSYNIALDPGQNSLPPNNRRMTGGSGQYLNYNIYTDNTYTTIWGALIGTNTVQGIGTGSPQNITAYGRVPAPQTVTIVGSYVDNIQVTVIF